MPRRTDFLIIGSGIAGLRAAADLAPRGRRARPDQSRSHREQHRLRAGRHCRRGRRRTTTPEQHAADTIAAGDGLCDRGRGRVLVEDGVRYVHELIEWGARFDRDDSGALALGREGAHGRRRVLHAADATGREIGRTLWERVAEQSRVRVERNARAHRADRRGRPLHRRPVRHERRSCTRSMPARCCWPPAARARCFAKPPIRRLRPATA